MALRPGQGQKPAPASSQADAGADALGVLHPERTVTLAGRTVTVREYGHIEGLHLLGWAKPFCEDLYALVSAASQAPGVLQINDLVVRHVDLVRDMAAQAITPVVDDADAFARAVAENKRWISALADIEGRELLAAWWQVCAGFFIRRLLERAAVERAAPRAASPSAGSASTTP